MTSNERLGTSAKRQFLRDVVVEQLRQLIEAGDLHPGDRLPPERALAARFAVSRHSLREALRVLEQQHVLQTRVGSGTYVMEKARGDSDGLTREALQERSNVLEILEYRRTVEPRTAFLAAMHATLPQKDALCVIISHQQKAVKEKKIDNWNQLDGAFHAQLAAMSGNFLFAKTTAILTQAMIAFRESSGVFVPVRLHDSMRHHEEITKAVLEGNAAYASEVMEQHIILAVRNAITALPGV